jgi:hypothetical protein
MFQRWHRIIDRQLNAFDLTRNPRWYSKELEQGSVVAGNVDPAIYFRVMYGKTPSQWLAVARRLPSMMVKPVNNGIYTTPWINDLSPEESARSQAESAFADFCRTLTNSVAEGN